MSEAFSTGFPSEAPVAPPRSYVRGDEAWYVPDQGAGALHRAVVKDGPHGHHSPFYGIDVPDCPWFVATARPQELFTLEKDARQHAWTLEIADKRQSIEAMEASRETICRRIGRLRVLLAESMESRPWPAPAARARASSPETPQQMVDLDPSEVRLRIAVRNGWTCRDDAFHGRLWKSPDGERFTTNVWPPDYPGDLNALREVLRNLSDEEMLVYRDNLEKVLRLRLHAEFEPTDLLLAEARYVAAAYLLTRPGAEAQTKQ